MRATAMRRVYLVGAAIALFGTALLPQSAAARFVQQGPKLVAADASGFTDTQGSSVALSADGKTAIVGGPGDGNGGGAAWVFIRDGNGTWQQAQKLVGTGASGLAKQGFAVAI